MTIKEALIKSWEAQDAAAFGRVCENLRFNHNYTWERTFELLKRHFPAVTESEYDGLLYDADNNQLPSGFDERAHWAGY